MAKNDIKTEYMPFADKLRKEVKAKGLTQATVGEAVGAKGVTVGAWCCGRSAPDDDTVRALEDLLGLKDGSLAALLPKDRQQRSGKKTAPPVQQQSKLTSEKKEAPSVSADGATSFPDQSGAPYEVAAAPHQTRGPKPQPEQRRPELMNLPWCIPAQCAHMKKVLDLYEEALIGVYMEKAKGDKEAAQIKRETLSLARQDLKLARTALSDLEQQAHLLLEVRA